MNEKNVGTVDVLKKRFECFQSSKKPVLWLDERQHEKNVNKRNIKRTPAFRRDVNVSRKFVDHFNAPVAVTNNVKSTYTSLNTGKLSKISQTNPPSYKTELLNQKSQTELFDKNDHISDQKAQLIHSLKSKLESNCSANCKPKVPKKIIERTLKTPLPVGPPPKKPPRTFAHDKKIDPNYTFVHTMEYHENPKSDPKVMLEKLKIYVSEQSPKCELKDKKTTELDCNQKKNSKMLNLVNLAKSITCLSSQNIYSNNVLKIRDTDEQNYLKTKSFCENNIEHIYAEPIFHPQNSRLNRIDSGHAPINNEWVYESNESNLHYLSSPIQNYNTEQNLKQLEPYSKIDPIDELDSKNTNMTISNERKIQMLMNEAYGTFIKVQEESDSESISNNDDSSNGSTNNLVDKSISEQTLERKGYLRRVTKKFTSSNSSVVQDKKHLFQALLLIGLDLSSNKEKLPYIKFKCPEQAEVPKQIESLCFPDAHVWPFSANDCRMYSLTVTDENGRRYYGYCCRVKPEGDANCLPLVYCLYSSIKANSFYFKVLQEIESRHGLSETKMKNFIELLYNQSFPELGSTIFIPQESIASSNEFSTNDEELRRPFDVRQEQDDLFRLLLIIKPNIFIQMLATMLLERKLILLSKSISLLSSCIEGLVASLYPFTWQHTLVSVFPSQIISTADFIQAPTPYIIGLLKTENQLDIFSQLSADDQVFIFDLDTNKILRKVKDEYSVIPSRIAKGLKSVIGLKVELDQSTKAVLASESLIRLFVELVGHFRTFVVLNPENKQYEFQKQCFIRAGINTAHQNFLEWFTETAMFSSFINSKMHFSNDIKDVFEQRCAEFALELNKIKHKPKTFSSMKALGDRIKDWAVS